MVQGREKHHIRRPKTAFFAGLPLDTREWLYQNGGVFARVKDLDSPVATGLQVQILGSRGKKGLFSISVLARRRKLRCRLKSANLRRRKRPG